MWCFLRSNALVHWDVVLGNALKLATCLYDASELNEARGGTKHSAPDRTT